MSAVETSTSQSSPGSHIEQATVTPLRPLPEGVFFTGEEIPEELLGADIEKVDLIYAKEHPRGLITREAVTFQDGTTYPVTTGMPAHQRSDTAIVFKTAWLTSSKGGHNMHTFLAMLQLGYPVIMVGSVGEIVNEDLSLSERLTQASRVTLPKIAHDVNRIADLKTKQLGLREDARIGIGESQGAGVGFGLEKLVYGDYVAPPFKRPIEGSELLDVCRQAIIEPFALCGVALKRVLARDRALKHYAATFYTDPEHILKELFKIPAFLDGQAGGLLATMEEDTPIHLRALRKDGWGQVHEYERVIARRPRSRFELVGGRHVNIGDPRTLGNLVIRLDELATERGPKGSFDDVDFHAVLHAAEAARAAKSRTKTIQPDARLAA